MILGAEVPHPLPAGGAGSELLAKTVRPLTESAVRFVCAAAAAGCAAPCVGGGRDAIVASQAEPVDAKNRSNAETMASSQPGPAGAAARTLRSGETRKHRSSRHITSNWIRIIKGHVSAKAEAAWRKR